MSVFQVLLNLSVVCNTSATDSAVVTVRPSNDLPTEYARPLYCDNLLASKSEAILLPVENDVSGSVISKGKLDIEK